MARAASHEPAPRPRAPGSEAPLGESRLWPAAALVVFLGLNIVVRAWLWDDSPVRVPWLLLATEVVLLVLLAADSNSVGEALAVLRRVALTVVVLVAGGAVVDSAARLTTSSTASASRARRPSCWRPVRSSGSATTSRSRSCTGWSTAA